MTCRAVSCDCNLLMTFRPMRIIVHSGSIKSGISPRLYSKNTCGRSPFFAYICQCFCLRISSAVVIYLPVLSSFLNGLVQRVELQNRGRVLYFTWTVSSVSDEISPLRTPGCVRSAGPDRCREEVPFLANSWWAITDGCLLWEPALCGYNQELWTTGWWFGTWLLWLPIYWE